MNKLPQVSVNTASPAAIAAELKSLKTALDLILAALPEDQRIKVQQQLIASMDRNDVDLATQLNQFIFIE
ncbi:hypothetical protein NUG10_002564 [Yersinia enterocolitica]|nr:hypothetical protein [Yersinia enterocolitica]EKN3872895.1 hypothetical protein [Yersinia enterocolitica]